MLSDLHEPFYFPMAFFNKELCLHSIYLPNIVKVYIIWFPVIRNMENFPPGHIINTLTVGQNEEKDKKNGSGVLLVNL